MNRRELIEYVLDQAGKHVGHDDIVLVVCQTMDLEWSQAEALVDEILTEYRYSLAARQSPLLVLIGVGVLLGGMFLAGMGLYYVFFEAEFSSGGQLLAGLQAGYPVGVMIGLGLGMIAGSIYGLSKLVSQYLDRWGLH